MTRLLEPSYWDALAFALLVHRFLHRASYVLAAVVGGKGRETCFTILASVLLVTPL